MRVWMVDAAASGNEGPIVFVAAELGVGWVEEIDWSDLLLEYALPEDARLAGIVHTGGAKACEEWVERNEERIKHLRERML